MNTLHKSNKSIGFHGILLLLFILCSFNTIAQHTITQCQTETDALIGTDRNDWSHNNLDIIDEGYLHNFDPIELPCGLENASLTNVEITITLETYAGTIGCNNIPVFGNVLLNCPLTTNSVCGIVQDVLTPGCAFGGGSSAMGNYALNLNPCGVNPTLTDVIGVDLIPATELLGSCPTIADAITSGNLAFEYTICISYTLDQALPNLCDNTITLPCNDGDDCTINDEITVDACDNNEVCIPCAGTLEASCDDTESLPCNDGDPCTINDMVVVSACDNTVICEPCMGELEAECTTMVSLPCDDGDDCTENDLVGVWECDLDIVCMPCAGTAVAECSNTISLPCDDGDDCTINDMEVVDACTTSIVCEPCAGVLNSSCDQTVVLPCDDGDACTVNDSQIVSACDNDFVCEPCMGELVVDCSMTVDIACDDGDPCTVSDMVTVSACDNDLVCVPCQGVPAESCNTTISMACDDGDVCTENDVEWIDACDTSVICIPCAGTQITPIECDDGDCDNGVEVWDENTCSCITVTSIEGCTDPESCNYDPLANCDSGCDYSCEDCLGVVNGVASVDACGNCLLPEDPLRDISCLDLLYVPNAFTPDSDDINDYFFVKTGRALAYFEIRIFDRVGQEVFYSTNPNFRWNGNIKDGNYYGMNELYAYRIQYSYELPELIQKTGTVSMIR